MLKILLVLGLAWAANACNSNNPVLRLPISHPGHALVNPGTHGVAKHPLIKPHVKLPHIKHPHISPGPIDHHVRHKIRLPKQEHDEIYEIPPYFKTKHLVERMENELLSHTTFIAKPDIHDPRRHYMLLIGVLFHITEVVANTCHPDPVMYDHYYMAMFDEYVSRAWNNPQLPADGINFYISLAKSSTADIRHLITDLCGTENMDSRECDKMVAGVLVYSPEEYKEQAKLLLKMGQVAELFEPFAPELATVAKNQQEIDFLLDNLVKERLKPLVLTAAEVILDFHLDGQCENPPPMHVLPLPKSQSKQSSHHKSLLPMAKVPLVHVMPTLW